MKEEDRARRAQVTESLHRNGAGEQVDRVAREVIGAAIEVHRVLGPGYLESVIHQAQLISYLKATQKRLGLMINFNVSVLLGIEKRASYEPRP